MLIYTEVDTLGYRLIDSEGCLLSCRESFISFGVALVPTQLFLVYKPEFQN
jgi:hypothetical protein